VPPRSESNIVLQYPLSPRKLGSTAHLGSAPGPSRAFGCYRAGEFNLEPKCVAALARL